MSSGFISETELAEQRRIRQEEWERVRTASQPLTRPEEPHDSRSLYERLLEQKNKKDAEYEEAHKLKNMIKGLDDDEVEFLDLIDRTKLEEERKKNLEEEKEMRDFKAAVASLQEKTLDERLKQELRRPKDLLKDISSKRSSQPKLLAGVVVKKSEKGKQENYSRRGIKRKISVEKDESDVSKEKDNSPEMEAVKCAKTLPGLCSYNDSSDSDHSLHDNEQTPRPKCPQPNDSDPRVKGLSENKKS